MTVVWLKCWHWPDYSDAIFYGWRHAVVVGPLMILWGYTSEAERDAWWLLH